VKHSSFYLLSINVPTLITCCLADFFSDKGCVDAFLSKQTELYSEILSLKRVRIVGLIASPGFSHRLDHDEPMTHWADIYFATGAAKAIGAMFFQFIFGDGVMAIGTLNVFGYNHDMRWRWFKLQN
jgi:hypothetical protein